jgi:RNA polymerase sigma factor (sigma-70 family)
MGMQRETQITRIAHDPVAFEQFYRANVEHIQRFVARRVNDPQLAADLTADVFLAAIDAAPGYDPELGEPTPWLFGVARNVVASGLRRVGREHDARMRFAGHRLLDEDDFERMAERIDAQAAARELYPAIANLPEGERTILELVAIDGLSVAQAASVAGVRPATARVRLYRARRAVRSHMQAGTPEPEIQPRPMEAP